MKLLKSFLVLVLILCLMGCSPDSFFSGEREFFRNFSSNGAKESDSKEKDPDFDSDNNFFQDGAIKYFTRIEVYKHIERSLYLRGKKIHEYLKIDEKRNQKFCLVQRFQTLANTHEILLTAAIPRTFPNLKTGRREHYFFLSPNKEIVNKQCQIPNAYTNESIIYKMSSLCPSCINSSLLALFDVTGEKIEDINFGNIKINIKSKKDLPISTSEGCQVSACEARGYDCCLNDQCVKNKSIKSTTDQSSTEFLQIQEQIIFNPSIITDYTNFYNICAQSIPSTEVVTSNLSNGQKDAEYRLQKKRELYDCINPIEGEMSLCTVTYKNFDEGRRDLGGPSSGDDGFIFNTGTDDLNFNDTYSGPRGGIPRHSIHKITYAGIDLFKENIFLKKHFSIEGVQYPASGVNINGNDDFVQAMEIKIFDSFPLDPDTINKEVKITYKTNGTCIPINRNIARCKKFYIQGESLGKVTDHYPATQSFLLPKYANTSRTIQVTVDNEIAIKGTHWNLVSGYPKKIEFKQSKKIFNTQKVKVSFYVDLQVTNVLQIVEESREEIRKIFQCAGTEFNLTPLEDNDGNIIDYECSYPKSLHSSEPFQKTIFLSSKTVPVRYFDENGNPHFEINGNIPRQEGTPFEYIDGRLDRPNNVESYIGFNEIYGSFNNKTLQGPKPAKKISVVKGKNYDIFTESGSFSSCLSCGHDYWSTLLRLFPRNFTDKGGGLVPNFFETNPKASTTYRKDDLLFGRACFLPVTMIPWTHWAHPDRQTQRLDRYSAQHFLFANGYQRDWYGFDYGSVIGSWDGFIWFSIGNQRRVRAKSHNLFLAVNTYWGDLVDENDFTISISEAVTSIPDSGSKVTNDYESDGAECQQYHACDVDRDCITKLGWDYACESIVGLKTLWPKINAQGMEIAGSEQEQSLRFLFNQYRGPPKRCIYRGRGAPCLKFYETAHSNSTFNKSDKQRHLVCSTNNHCHALITVGKENNFNTKISRFGRSISYQNQSPYVKERDLDTFGLHAREIGRPMEWNGKESVPNKVFNNMSYNNVQAVCIPGRGPADTMEAMNNNTPSRPEYWGDKSLGIGMTERGTRASNDYFSACPVLDLQGNLIHFDYGDRPTPNDIDGMEFYELSSMQNTSTNALLFLNDAERNGTIAKSAVSYANFDFETITRPKLELNRCLRMPGAACYSDYDCMSSDFIVKTVKAVDSEDTSLNDYELSSWKETLVCSQDKDANDPDYNLENNRCCRQTKEVLTVGTWQDGLSTFDHLLPTVGMVVPGVNIAIDSQRRYGLYNVVADILAAKNHPTALQGPVGNDCSLSTGCLDKEDSINHQYRIFPRIPERVCCSGHWIREFHEDNGGGHLWDAKKHQLDFKVENFRCYNWIDLSEQLDIIGGSGKNDPFSCSKSEDALDLDCGIRSVPTDQAENVLNWLGTLELTGIPQATMMRPWSNSMTYNDSDLFCEVDPANQTDVNTLPQSRIPGVFADLTEDVAEIEDDDGFQYFSLDDMKNFNDQQIKQVFSKDKTVCCIPAGEKISVKNKGDRPDQDKCCTGYVSSKTGRCALKDYTNISVYFNRFVSSAAKELNEDHFDSNGFLRSPAMVEFLACRKKVCDSGVFIRGVAWSNVRVPGKAHENEDVLIRQFLDSKDREEDDFNGLVQIFQAGPKWNAHVYCAPSNIDTNAPELVAIQCE